MVPFLLLLPEPEEIFLRYLLGNLVEVPEVNLTVWWGPPRDWVCLMFFAFKFVYTELLKLVSCSLGFSFSDPCSQGSFSCESRKLWYPVFTFLFPVAGWALPCVLSSFTDPGRVDHFSVFQLFTCCWNTVMTFKLITCRTRKNVAKFLRCASRVSTLKMMFAPSFS